MHSAKIIVLCAIYAEAEPLIGYYDLKKSFADFRLDSYVSSDGTIALFITGTGIVRAAAAVGAVCTYFSVDSSTQVLNVGTCAGGCNMAGLYRINKLVNASSGRTFYPDILLRADMPEAVITTVSQVISDTDSYDMLYDMEAAAIYEAAAVYLAPHQMTFIKMVSDKGVSDVVTKESVTKLVSGFLPQITSFIEKVKVCFCGSQIQAWHGDGEMIEPSPDGFHEVSQEQEPFVLADFVSSLSEDMHCSATMTHQLFSLVTYAALTDYDYRHFFEKYYENGSCSIRGKKAAMQVIDEFREALIGE